ncbi:hypothetical protein VaNZ11_005089, partial [Volvox africanus]
LTIAEAVATELQLHHGIAETLLGMLEDKFKSSACHMWALSNIMNPRPPCSVKALLASYTGRSQKQVTDWFTNWRARHWRPTILSMPLHQRIRLGIAASRRFGRTTWTRRLSCHGDAFGPVGGGDDGDGGRIGGDVSSVGSIGAGFRRFMYPLSPSTTTEDEEEDGDDPMEDLYGILYGNDPMVDEYDDDDDVGGYEYGCDGGAAPLMPGQPWLSD